MDDYRSVFESRISAGAMDTNEQKRKPRETWMTETISSWSYDMSGHANEISLERYCRQLAKNNETMKQSRDAMHGLTISFGEEEKWISCTGRPDISWSANKLARAVTKWTKTSDKRLDVFDLLHSSHM